MQSEGTLRLSGVVKLLKRIFFITFFTEFLGAIFFYSNLGCSSGSVYSKQCGVWDLIRLTLRIHTRTIPVVFHLSTQPSSPLGRWYVPRGTMPVSAHKLVG